MSVVPLDAALSLVYKAKFYYSYYGKSIKRGIQTANPGEALRDITKESLVIRKVLTALMALTTLYILKTVSLLLPMGKEKGSTGQAVNGIGNIGVT